MGKLIKLGEKLVTNREGDQIESDFLSAVQDGTVLCRILVAIEPGSVPKFHNRPKLEFLMIENAQLFLNACQTFGVKPEQLCETLDITEKRNLKKITRVVTALYQLAVDKGYDVPPLKRTLPKRDLSHQNEGFIVSAKIEPKRKRSSSDMVAKNIKINQSYFSQHVNTLEKIFNSLDKRKSLMRTAIYDIKDQRNSISSADLEKLLMKAMGKRSQHKLSDILKVLEEANSKSANKDSKGVVRSDL